MKIKCISHNYVLCVFSTYEFCEDKVYFVIIIHSGCFQHTHFVKIKCISHNYSLWVFSAYVPFEDKVYFVIIIHSGCFQHTYFVNGRMNCILHNYSF